MHKSKREESLQSRVAAIERQFEEKKRELLSIGFLWRGNIQRRWVKCNQPTCACAQDAKARHGPYYNRTIKIKGKTVSELLTLEEATLYEEWIENRRKLEKLVKQLTLLSQKAGPMLLRIRSERVKK